ncbi:MAG TPA: DUF423 domain-containing protein [Salinimicrobium catena]|uniref:DUF423 domain-containing protein n=1 Tax=Salinimicrobium catena TaxID=390640 RepID=A0A7C2R4N2_9FLAO|nr:DUF423 domain-containing protein [Salinimicrobium catena]
MNRNLLIAGAFFGMIGIIIGAFAAHGLKPLLTAENMLTFETGVKYQMYSALFMLVLGGLPMVPEKVKKACFYLTVTGILFFSGSIFLLATNSLSSFDFRVIALITPAGGTLLISAWIVLLISVIKLKKK